MVCRSDPVFYSARRRLLRPLALRPPALRPPSPVTEYFGIFSRILLLIYPAVAEISFIVSLPAGPALRPPPTHRPLCAGPVAHFISMALRPLALWLYSSMALWAVLLHGFIAPWPATEYFRSFQHQFAYNQPASAGISFYSSVALWLMALRLSSLCLYGLLTF